MEMVESRMQTGDEQQKIVVPEIRNITVGLDGSKWSLDACRATGVLAKALGAKVTAVYVLPKFISIRRQSEPGEAARASLEEAMSMLSSYEGVIATSEILESRSLSVSEPLIEYLAREKPDLMVCGSRGLGGFERLLLGSVSSDLVAHSPTSVMIVRAPHTAETETPSFGRILVATDGSEFASKGVGLAIRLAKALPSKLTFVNVVYSPPVAFGAGDWYDRAIAESRAEGKKVTAAAADFARDSGIVTDTKVIDEMSSPVEAITKLGKVENYNLIILGTRGLGGFERIALGSVASGVVHYANCSVVVAK